VQGGDIVDLWFGYKATGNSNCTDAGQNMSGDSIPVTGSTFQETSNGSPFSYTTSGTFSSGSSMSGNLSFKYTDSSAGGCTGTGTATFTASKVPATSYDGTWTGPTSQSGQTVKIIVSGNEITELDFGYDFTDVCSETVAFQQAMSPPVPIIAGQSWVTLDISGSNKVVAGTSFVYFTAPKAANGTLDFTFSDFSDFTNPCTESDTGTFTPTRP
jgi:hypothetical protein